MKKRHPIFAKCVKCGKIVQVAESEFTRHANGNMYYKICACPSIIGIFGKEAGRNELKHFCIHCGTTKKERAYWKYLVDNDPELAHAKPYQKKTIVDMIIFYKQKNLNSLKPQQVAE